MIRIYLPTLGMNFETVLATLKQAVQPGLRRVCSLRLSLFPSETIIFFVNIANDFIKLILKEVNRR